MHNKHFTTSADGGSRVSFLQIPKETTVKTAESAITNVIHLKHTLELVEPLKAALQGCQSVLLQGFHKVFANTSIFFLFSWWTRELGFLVF